ncbi:MAG: beta-propeller domain-containing protein, partial [Candidatus Thermoplasmatota archaeon]|nr:beta-propeller domain-containing protein [Candidatus Thermoplasmatota archaeon]
AIVGRLENLAPGEKIYSSRFMGDRCYLVTFKKIDPFFVIDLSNPTNPHVLGKLKIPGYSDYLHPYDENHMIGLGKETVEAEEGNFAWYQGVKLSLFDVTDVTNPVELSKYVIGDRGTTSEALYDHKAFLFSRSNNLLIIPITLAKIDPDKYPNGIPPNTRGDIVWTGACVFSLTIEGGFQPRGGISHANDIPEGDYGGWSYYSVRRSLYIEELIYTISESLVKINRMDDLAEIGELEL